MSSKGRMATTCFCEGLRDIWEKFEVEWRREKNLRKSAAFYSGEKSLHRQKALHHLQAIKVKWSFAEFFS